MDIQYANGVAWASDVIPWSVTDEPLRTADGIDTGHRATVRVNPDGSRQFLGVVKGRYSYGQPGDILAEHVFPFIAAGCELERVTVLKGGAKIGVQLRLPSEAVRIGDSSDTEIRPLLTYADSFDGSTHAFVRDICQAIVCQNTHALAMMESASLGAVVRHTGGNDNFVQRLADASAGVAERLKAWREVHVPAMRRVYDLSATRSESLARNYFGAVLNDADPDSPTVNKLVDIWSDRLIGQTGNMAWDSAQAVTQWLTHERGRNTAGADDRRAYATTAGQDALIGARAWKLAGEMLTR